MSRRILIVADAYGKPAYAPRLRYLCDYLHRQGWIIEVYTERFIELDFAHDYPIYEINLYRNRTWDWAIKTAWSLLTDWKNRCFTNLLLQAVCDKDYDMVFCTTFNTFPLRAALAVAKQKNIPLHADLRDLDEQVAGAQYQEHRAWYWRPFRQWYRQVNIYRRNRVLRQAAQLTTVSPWHQQFLSRINSNTHLIYNGFDSRQFTARDIPTDTFDIIYTGRLYEPVLQDPTLLFQALKQLKKLSCLRVCFYTDRIGRERIISLARQYNVEHIVEIYDYVRPSQVQDILHKCSIALVFSNLTTAKGPFGIMTTKFFEALGVEKPILCVRSDESVLAQAIAETNAGIAARTADEVEEFIMEKYNEWKTNGFTRQMVRNKSMFDREYQAEQFEELFDTIIQK